MWVYIYQLAGCPGARQSEISLHFQPRPLPLIGDGCVPPLLIMSHSLNRVQWLESRKGGFLPDQTRLVWQELERRRGCLPRPRSSKSKEAKHSNNVFNTAVNFHLCLVNILQGFTWNVSWYGMPAQWGKRYSEFLIFDWCLKLCSLVWWLGCQASQHGKTDQFWSSHSFHVFFFQKN